MPYIKEFIVIQKLSVLYKALWVICCIATPFHTTIFASSYNIGSVQDGTFENYDDIKTAIIKELNILAEGQFEIRFPKEFQLNGEFNLKKIRSHTEALANNSQLDLILSIGHESSKQLVNIRPLNVPVVAVGVESPFLLGYVNPVNMKPVNPNWTTSYDTTLESSVIFALNELLNFKKIAFITSDFFYKNNHSLSVKSNHLNYKKVSGQLRLKGKTLKVRVSPNRTSPVIDEKSDTKKVHPIFGEYEDWFLIAEGWVHKDMIRVSQKKYFKSRGSQKSLQDVISEYASTLGFSVEAVSVNPKNFRDKIGSVKADAVLVSNLFQFTDQQRQAAYQILSKKKIPAISGTGVKGVKDGALFSVWKDNFQEIGRTFALKAYSILTGTPPSEISIVDKQNLEVTFNMDTVQKIGFNIPVKYLYEDNLFKAETNFKKLNLKEATALALKENPTIKIANQQAKQIESQVGVARGYLLPQISSSLTASQIDETRAGAAPGTTESETVVTLSLSQKIWDSSALNSLETAKLAHRISDTQIQMTEANLEQAVAQAYLNVLYAKEVVKTRREHLKAYRSLKEIAQLKYELQATGKNDVLQVNRQFDDARIQLTTAIEDWINNSVTLNNYLNLPRDTRLTLAPLSIQNQKLKGEHFFLDRLVTVLDLKALGQMIDQRVMDVSYDLIAANQQLEQAKLNKASVKSEFMPSVSLGASWFRQLADQHTAYTGSTAQESEDAYDKVKQTGWSASLSLTLPIFSGGARLNRLDAANQKILELTHSRDKVKADLLKNSRILQNMLFNNKRRVDIIKNMLKTSQESFSLGQVSYQSGSTSMSDLITLQTHLISTEINLIRSRYQLYNSVVNILKMTNDLELLTYPLEKIKKDPLVQELETYFNRKNPKPITSRDRF